METWLELHGRVRKTGVRVVDPSLAAGAAAPPSPDRPARSDETSRSDTDSSVHRTTLGMGYTHSSFQCRGASGG